MSIPRRITFVRHGMPAVDGEASPAVWPLIPEAVVAAGALRLDAASERTVIVSSPERKAVQTCALAVGASESAVLTDAGLREIDRIESVDAGFRDARRAWIASRIDERHRGWESPDAAARRFHEALLRHRGDHLIVATHGMVLTCWLVAQGIVASGGDAIEFWESLRFPDVLELDLPLLRVRAVLTDADGRFVLIKRTRPGREPYWTTPGGGVLLADASPESALRRELREELGAEAELGEVVFERRLDGIRSEIFYAATLTSIDPALADGPEFGDPSRGRYDVEFVRRDELRTLDLRPDDLKRLLLNR